eukprot:TRINITY_DN50473_c0_g1_i1.p1 TRINITY_DN50473_c0_g1~~TRINITY_DN50473_c0_g1_i1.p1  ORF type:complete len:642 (-),score=123.12 TRINITY_DN50473_c0_g1_i1:118-1974(-)
MDNSPSPLPAGYTPATKVSGAGRLNMPILTVRTIAGNVVWGPEEVSPGMTVADLASKMDRPSNSPGVKLVHQEEILDHGASLEELQEPSEIVVHFDSPKIFDHTFVQDLAKLAGESEGLYMPDTEVLPDEVQVTGAEVTRAVILEADWDSALLRLSLRLPASSPMIVQRSDEELELKLESGKFPRNGLYKYSVGDDDDKKLTARILDKSPDTILAELELRMDLDESIDEESEDQDMQSGPWGVALLSTPLDQLMQRHTSKLVREGVNFKTGGLSQELTKRLSSLIDELKSSTDADYHPGTEDVVRDIVHPALFPYVEGISVTNDLSDVATKEAVAKDMWGRPYESSKYQWLPAEVFVSANGKCKFETYINNLNQERQPALYEALEELLSEALPHLEAAWSHGSAVKAPARDDFSTDSDCERDDPEALEEKSLRNQRIQVIVKIVDYELPAKGVHEGVWHVEGMSHENIVATAELILQKDAALKGGDLEFQRSFTSGEGSHMVMKFPQERPGAFDEVVEKGLVPLGHLPLPCGRLASWPNSHIHRVTRIENTSGETATRRIVVFWLVNPERRIVSTKHVPAQQGRMPLEEALKHRLALMEERKYHKQAWNLRKVTLCEH